VGGVLTSFFGELLVYPSIYFIWRSRKLKKTALFPAEVRDPLPAPETDRD